MLNQQLANIIATGRISHSWLLTGPEEQLLPQARELAQALLCAEPREGYPCGECPSCRKVENDNHPDLQVIRPDGASVKIKQTRQMQHFANLESYEGGKQVIIIHGAHTMQKDAANSILKILEEPPPHTHFILTAPVGDNLLTTILSRVVWVRLAAGGDGLPDQAEAELRHEMREKALELLKLLPAGSGTLLKFADGFKTDKKRNLTGKKQLICFLEELLACLRDLIVTNYAASELLPSRDRIPQTLTPAAALTAANLVEEYAVLAKGNINTALLLSVLILKLQDLHNKQV